MDRTALIQLTNNLYKLTLLFPKKEPLRYKMRELGVNILVKPSREDFEALDSFFEVVKVQRWVDPADSLAMQAEYANFKRAFEQEKEIVDKELFPHEEGSSGADFDALGPETLSGFAPISDVIAAKRETIFPEKSNPRQSIILNYLKENGRAQVWQIKEIFPDISKRTLRRDFEQMLGQGTIERIGERNDTFYQIKKNI